MFPNDESVADVQRASRLQLVVAARALPGVQIRAQPRKALAQLVGLEQR